MSHGGGGHGGGHGGHGGGHGGHGGGGYGITQYISPVEVPRLPDLDFQNPVKPEFLTCANSALSVCYSQFGSSSESFADCMYGFLLTSRLLPTSVMALAHDVRIQTSGAFAEGASQSCDMMPTFQGHPGIMDFY
jgi:hypothetical protein